MKTQPLQKEIISKNEAAYVLSCRPETIATLCEVGFFTCRSNGKTHKLFMEEIKELIKNLRTYDDARWCKNPKHKALMTKMFYQKNQILTTNEYSRN